jgi:uncharacterized protein
MKKLYIEIANNPESRSKGLMYRKELMDDHGMLFKFDSNDHLSFWMKNTYIPLDIAFLDDRGKILQISEMYPLSTRRVISKVPCKLALEVNKGWFDKNKIGEGDVLSGIELSDKKFKINKISQLDQSILNELSNLNLENNDEQKEEQQNNPKVQMILNDKAKVKYAEQKNLALQIVYKSEQSGQILPPRKLIPSTGEGYPMGTSKNGDYFTAFDSSPRIEGGNYTIEGNQIKRFLFNNIIVLEVLEEFVK